MDDLNGNIALCNLTTKELKLLPPPESEPLPNPVAFFASGLGYDPKSNDFKVIRFFKRPYYHSRDGGTERKN